ncbi:MAG: hypothetical protein ABGY75_20770 [Gemmataceae bacterium]
MFRGQSRRAPVLWIGLIASSLTGCGLFHEYRPMRVLVRDAETKQPLPGAEIEGMNMVMLDVFGPSSPHGTTDASGVATLKIGPERGFDLRVDEPGYEMTDHREESSYFNTLPKRGGPGDDPKRIDVVMDLPRRHGTTVVVVVPDGYRGLVRVKFEPTDDPPDPTKHVYTAVADASGRAVVRVPEISLSRDIAARYRNGKKVPWDANSPNSDRVAIRHLADTLDTSLYLIGTGPEAEEHDQQIRKQKPDGRRELDQAAYDRLFRSR